MKREYQPFWKKAGEVGTYPRGPEKAMPKQKIQGAKPKEGVTLLEKWQGKTTPYKNGKRTYHRGAQGGTCFPRTKREKKKATLVG